MAVFKFHITTDVDIDSKVLQFAAVRLKGYFDRICKRMNPKAFSHSSFSLSPNAGDVGDKDLLVHVVQQSKILKIDPNASIHSKGGATALLSSGLVLSEVYWGFVKNNVKDRGTQGIALANLAMHEFAHNKHMGTGVDIHVSCGGGLFGLPVMPAMIWGGDLGRDNEICMAKVLDRVVRQYKFDLYDEELGF